MRSLALAALLLGSCVATPPDRPAPEAVGACERAGSAATEPREWSVVHRDPRGGLYRQPLRVVVGGDLASYPLANLAVGTYWFRRDAAPEPSIRLVARRLDAPGDVEFEAIGYELGQRGLPQGWDAGWYYRTSVHELDRFPLPAGCWRVLLVDGRPGDSIVYEFPRPRLPDFRG